MVVDTCGQHLKAEAGGSWKSLLQWLYMKGRGGPTVPPETMSRVNGGWTRAQVHSRYEKETNPHTKFNDVTYSQIPENTYTENRSSRQRQRAAISSLTASLTPQTWNQKCFEICNWVLTMPQVETLHLTNSSRDRLPSKHSYTETII